VESFVASPLLPAAVQGTAWDGIAHSSDWYVTFVEGIAGGTLPANTGDRPPDGFNLWPALRGDNLTSPRTEVIHAVQNRYFNRSLGDSAVAAGRFGDYKIIQGMSCTGSEVWQAWPEPAGHVVPFGLTTGWIEPGTDHARAGLLGGHTDVLRQQRLGADPNCSNGLRADYHNHGDITCCAKSCGVCGLSSECQLPEKDGKPCPCASRPGGADACCVSTILQSKLMCADHDAPCVISIPNNNTGCLFNLATDREERHNLAQDPAHQALFLHLAGLLAERGATGPPLSVAFPNDVGPLNKTASAAICAQEQAHGYLEPLDWRA